MKKYKDIINEYEQIIPEFEILEEDKKKYESAVSELQEVEYSEHINITNAYYQEVNNIPLLTEEEEVRLLNDLKLINNLNIVTQESKDNKCKCAMIDLPLVFKLCCNNKDYKVIIESLLLHFQTNENIFYKNLYPIINKYANISRKLGRPLNEEELKEHFQLSKEKSITLSSEELLTQVKDYLKYKDAFDRLFCSNLKLVVSIAHNYIDYGYMLDFINEGNEALIIAINKNDVSLGYKFSTYAFWWIWQAIRKYVIEQEFLVRVPFHIKEKILEIERNVSLLEQNSQKRLTNTEIAENLNIPVSQLEKYLKYSHDFRVKSLDNFIKSKDKLTIGDFVKDNISIENNIINSQIKEDIKVLYKNLTSRELQVIKMRFGLDEYNEQTHTLKEVEKELGITAEGVRKLELRALNKMKRLSKVSKYNSLKDYLN